MSVGEALDTVHDMHELIAVMRRVVELLDACRAEPCEALATGVMRDAQEWLENVARRLVAREAEAAAACEVLAQAVEPTSLP